MTVRPGPDWFTGGYAEVAFEHHLAPLVGAPVDLLQIGAYCGDASEWLARNILTGPVGFLMDVDTWEGSAEVDHEEIDFETVYRFYVNRVRDLPGQPVTWVRTTSDEFFAGVRGELFDFIYVDGAHTTEQVLRDAVNADRVLKVGGMIAFDDYRWGGVQMRDRPGPAIDAFLRCYETRYEVLERDLQVWVRKVR